MQNAVAYIHSFSAFGKEPGLHRIGRLLERLGNPQRKVRCFHVAGTNGKGSICCYISHILQSAGLKTGLFVSPYVLDFRERFQINGQMISSEELERLTADIRTVVDTLPPEEQPTQFDLITAIAFLYFYQNDCDVVVLETGLGGLYDSTNIIDNPLCTVIASISKDHTAVLGETIAQIATQKAGIIKPNGNTVLYPVQQPEAKEIIQQIAHKQNNRLLLPDTSALSVHDLGLQGSRVNYKGLAFSLRMCGAFQPLNAITAIEAIRCSALPLDDRDIICGLEQASFPARCEILEDNPPLVLDGAHNPDGLRGLADFLGRHIPQPTVAIMGMMADKDIEEALRIIAPCFTVIFCVAPENPRALSAEALAKLGAVHTKCTPCPTLQYALRQARKSGAAIVICGSLFLAAEAKKIYKRGCL